jgi:glycosidase
MARLVREEVVMTRALLAGAALLTIPLLGCRGHAPEAVAEAPPLRDAPVAAPWWRGAVFYEVFVRSFADGDGDGRGDLRGLIEKLDYLNDGKPETTDDLGVDALWLMPVFESPSYHGYDTVDYETIERDYGTNADFARLLVEAHRRGIRVIVDLVLNHTSDQHPWFLEAAKGPTSPRRDWYVWRKENPAWGQPWNPKGQSWHRRGDEWYYGLFWSGMPDLNFRNPAVRDELTRLARKWVEAGVDGFRLDAVRHLVETGPGAGQEGSEENHVYLRSLAQAVHAANREAAMVGEVWSTTDDIAKYFGRGGDELELLFDFPLAGALVKSAWSGDAQPILEALAQSARAFPPGAVSAPFLTNHDQPRVATALGKDPRRLRLAAALLLTMPGSPFIYYGEELGLPNGPGNEDEWKRTPMPWREGPGLGFTTGAPWHPSAPSQRVEPAAQQVGDPASLRSRYRALIKARRASSALSRGRLEVLPAPSGVLAFLRIEGEERVLVAHNLSGSAVTASLAVEGHPGPALFADPAVRLEVDRAGLVLRLGALESGAFLLQDSGRHSPTSQR